MRIFASMGRLVAPLAIAGIALTSAPAFAQEIGESHLRAARTAVSALGVTDEFDQILPEAAQQLKVQLISSRPDLVDLIGRTVDEEAISLAARRADLEREVATIYARIFSEQELSEIAAFYATDTGKKLIQDGTIALREMVQAAQIWQRGLSRDLALSVGTKLDTAVGDTPDAQQDGAPANAQPAPNQ